MSNKSVRDLVMEYLARPGNQGITNGTKIARAIGRPTAESTVYRILRELRGQTATGVAPGTAGTGGPARPDYLPRGLTRRRIEEYLDANPGESPSAGELAEKLGLNASTVGKNMRDIIRRRNARHAPKAPGKAKAAAKPKAAAQLATRHPAGPAEPAGNGVTALLLKLQASNFADVPLPPNVLIRQPGGPHHRDGIARDADGRIYELREL